MFSLIPPLLVSCAPAAQQASPIPLERVMADPEWIGRSPERPAWADDGLSLFFLQKRAGEDASEWVQIDLEGRELTRVPEEEAHRLDLTRGNFTRDHSRKVFERSGDLFVKDVATGDVRQLTRTDVSESGPRFLYGEESIVFRRGGTWFVRSLSDGFEWQPQTVVAEDDPDESDEDPETEYLDRQQERLFEHLRERETERNAREARQKAARETEPSRPGRPFYVGEETDVVGTYLGPRARYLIAVLADGKAERGKRDNMPNYVTEDGYVENRQVRSKVGTGKTRGERLTLFELETRVEHAFELSELPEISTDRMAGVRAEAEAWRAANEEPEEDAGESETEPPEMARATDGAVADDPGAETETDAAAETETEPKADSEEAEPEPRPVGVSGVDWNADGSRAALTLQSRDRKDSWIVLVDPSTRGLTVADHLHDPAWVLWRFRRKGWTPDGDALWFLSEAGGYSHLFVFDVASGETRRLTEGEWEVSDPVASRDGAHLYFQANREHPGARGFYRVPLAGGEIETVAALGGRDRAWLAPDERHVLIEHSSPLEPPDLWVQPLDPPGPARRLTDTTTAEFRAQPWIEPQVVAVPTRHGRPAWSRLYLPPDARREPAELRPAVLFVHGAGYLQNAHLGWSSYFREFMFHSLLAHRGYVVLDMDYRASAGYGRDWRAAIYRRMGEPEVEDLADGVRWLVDKHGVDAQRVGVYGGSYGGFLTLMALFQEPELFACGAALRPVTDWAHYSHGYTANILNTPEEDPLAYERSSPIEYAEGLSRPLLICHGMLDDNVFFQDTVRLVQRLIELEKEDFEVALYPIEPHGFREPSSWLDEYRRILKLFETHLRKGEG